MKKILFSLLFTSYLISDTITLTGTLRDFNQDHVDFEAHATWENRAYLPYGPFWGGKEDGLELGNVLEDLGVDGNPRVNPNSTNNFKPQKLEEWYDDVDGVNMSMPYSIKLKKISENLYQFSSDAFFPADGKLFGKETYHHQTGEEYQHNFHMTYKIHSTFTYKKGQRFNFTGDDDVWVFINKKLAVDLGGIHTSKAANVDLDTLGLVEGESYDFDFFWAERHSTGSNFTITTSMDFTKPKPFTCSQEAYLFNGTPESDAYTIDLATGKYGKKETIHNSFINGTGYNVKDDLIWGYDILANKVVRIDSNYKVTSYDVPELPHAKYYDGDVSQDGILYLKSHDTTKVYKINLNSGIPKYDGYITLSKSNLNFGDFAFSPKDDKLYSINEKDSHLYRIDVSDGTVTDLDEQFIDEGIKFHTYVFDRDANLYFYGSSGQIYKINLGKKGPYKTEPFSKTGIKKGGGDGARCPNAAISNSPMISISDAKVVEGDSGIKNIVFKVTSDKTIPCSKSFKLNYTLSEGSAKSGFDYKNISGSFRMKGRTHTLSLPIIKGDTTPEADEDFFIHLSSANANKAVMFSKDSARGVIIDDDKNVLNAYDITSSFSNPIIKTHIVNQPFALKIASVQLNGTAASSFTDMTNTKMKIVPSSSCTNDASSLNSSGFKPFSLTSHGQLSPTFKIAQAYKDARVQFYWEDASSGAKKASCSTDRFAIRPDKYIIQKPSSVIKSGTNFNIIVKAVDADGNVVSNYLENKSVYDLAITENKASSGCNLGTLSKTKHNFYTGASLVDLNYKDVGNLRVVISEKVGSEFAKVDSSDGSGSSRFITNATDNIIVDAANFSVNFSYTTQNQHPNYTYYSPDPTIMGARVRANVIVKNALGNPLPNFTTGCYAKNIAVTLNNTQTGTGTVEFKNPDKTNATDVSKVGGKYSYNVLGTSFTNGVGRRDLYMNFGRVIDTPKLPVKMQLSNPTAKIGTLVGTVNPLNKTISFLYARTHGQDEQSGIGSNFIAMIDYEVYLPFGEKSSDYTLPATLEKGKDDIRWSILPDDTSFDYRFGTTPSLKFGATITASTPETVSIRSANTPHTDLLIYDAKPYLSSSQESTGIKIKMLSPNNQWSGKGKRGQIFDDSASRKIKRRMEW